MSHCPHADKVAAILSANRDKSRTYTIPLPPVPLARHRDVKVGSKTIHYDPQSELKKQIQFVFLKDNRHPKIKGPIHMCICFYMPIPASLSATKQSKLNGAYHYKRPDESNMQKFYEDVMNEIVYKDDCQIADVCAHKIYAFEPSTVITLTPLTIE